ncbi:hypothetical protein M406DRAFT_329993 [Cryphonectria parasitica EP155]|uniref:Uncharacterized protein n=1 Tax=Cryphonectria parasitica (strain ATCC 38755 / EP155) TaxID=660469 RepID=A0A9P4Y3R9_CRYP1|nr:uncharacterized protein M406DRAFT_329993 [Cryphonectria parasitica EP155]KAF3766153.1 hypothetical protein M406DRAFT_329993 [Cryphonectria parasitica EP155]
MNASSRNTIIVITIVIEEKENNSGPFHYQAECEQKSAHSRRCISSHCLICAQKHADPTQRRPSRAREDIEADFNRMASEYDEFDDSLHPFTETLERFKRCEKRFLAMSPSSRRRRRESSIALRDAEDTLFDRATDVMMTYIQLKKEERAQRILERLLPHEPKAPKGYKAKRNFGQVDILEPGEKEWKPYGAGLAYWSFEPEEELDSLESSEYHSETSLSDSELEFLNQRVGGRTFVGEKNKR